MDDVAPASSLTPCPICGRTFRPDALARHQRICEKTKAKPRKVFDSSKQRVEGTEMKNAPKQVPPSPKVNIKTLRKTAQKSKPKTNWKEKHEELIRTIRAARGEDAGPATEVTTNNTTGGRPPVPAGYVECPTCNRNFSDRAADRHIAWCQERNNRIPPKSPASAEAVERLKARTKYKVPTPGKKNGTVSPSGSHGSKELAYKTVASRAAGNHKRTKSSPSKLEANGTSVGHPKKAAVKKAKPLPVPSKLKTGKAGGGVMKFKEKFPNHISSPYRYTDDGYDPYKKADLQMRELVRGTTLAPKNPRTVPGVRTQGLHNNTSSNTSDSNSYTSTNSGSENRLDEEMNFLNSKFAELARPGFTGEFTNNWAKRMNDNAVTVLSVQDPSNGAAPHGSRLMDHEPPTSSSGSDGSLPGYASTGSSAPDSKVPYLCHQCGSVYPVSAAKFCCECGARRLGLISLYGQ